jgi:Homeodomain-like domain
VLISADSLLRRRDLAEVIGAAVVAKASGVGHRRVATAAGVPRSTVRGWLRRFAANAEAIRVWFTVLAHDLDPMLAVLVPTATLLGDAVEAIAVAARAASLRLASVKPWSFASAASAGRLLSNTSWPWAPAG